MKPKEKAKELVDNFYQLAENVEWTTDEEKKEKYTKIYNNLNYVDFSNPNADKISSASTTTIKQETLEEVAERYSNNELSKLGFINGAKWQQERSYSEEEVIAFGEFIFKHSLLTHTIGVKSLFEQFKKK